ncbi:MULTISPECIES: phosphohistidine phosphatase SixA [Providencia]|uniref:phosphohistidine phosphatase SixA n=1 Tax=Providencia TaxID=586 RepID=UPI0015EBF461|nr:MULTISPECIES: phosphohistidine phosphatase SixA [Providencia]QLQ63451.1 phosphohistidine phosphatase SixA [Providencia rettgeri]URR22598.1 phosphohistidine phosphatase SixA [Providencia rettgeri]
MQVYIMRHGDAAIQAPSDAERPLTQKGKDDSVLMAQWLQNQGIKIDSVLVSPYLRAEQTRQVVSQYLDLPAKSEILGQLTPGGNAAFVADHIRDLAVLGANAILVVSHLPLVGYLVSELCPHKEPPMFTTSTVACVDIDVAHQKSHFEWMLSPSQLLFAK